MIEKAQVTHKQCTQCQETKEIRQFYKTEKGGFKSKCQDCIREMNLRRYRFVVRPSYIENRRLQGLNPHDRRSSANV